MPDDIGYMYKHDSILIELLMFNQVYYLAFAISNIYLFYDSHCLFSKWKLNKQWYYFIFHGGKRNVSDETKEKISRRSKPDTDDDPSAGVCKQDVYGADGRNRSSGF